MEGTRPLTIDVQALVAPSELAMPRRLASGFDRNRLSLLLAVLARHGGLGLGQHDVFVNVAGGVRVDEPAADLAVALALASAARGVALGPVCAFGEIALTGRLRPVTQPERRLGEAARLGLEIAIVPEGAPDGPLRVRHAATVRAACEIALGVAGGRARALLAMHPAAEPARGRDRLDGGRAGVGGLAARAARALPASAGG